MFDAGLGCADEVGKQKAVGGLRDWASVQESPFGYIESEIKEGRWDTAWVGANGVSTLGLLSGKAVVQ